MVRRSVKRGNGYSEKYTVSLYPLDAAILQVVQERQHVGTFSGALQFLIRRYADEHGIEVRGKLEPETEAVVR